MVSDDTVDSGSASGIASIAPTRRGWLRTAAVGSLGAALGLGGQGTATASGDERRGPPPRATPQTTLGVETLLDERVELLDGDRLGLITNPSGVDSSLTPTIDRLYEHDAFDLRKLFSPEHGIRGNAEAGEGVDDTIDEKTGLPVFSLYGDTRQLQPEMIEDVDAVLFDIQDVGVRFYTYIYDIARSLETIGQTDKRFVVLDRPNPIAPLPVTGSRIDDENASGIGDYRLPIIHGMTVGEIAQYFNDEFDFGADLEIVRMRGWNRGMWYDETGLPFVPPSPNMPTTETATIYPGMVYFEATTHSEGRGTTKPFEYVGAPWIDGQEWADALNDLGLPGVRFRPVWFEPTFDDHEGENVSGVQTHVVDRSSAQPVRVGLAMLVSAFLGYPESEWLSWGDTYAIDTRANGSELRETIDEAEPSTDPLALADQIRSGWEDDIDEFRDVRDPHLLYDDRWRGRRNGN
ncbi:exo-beta-N-acetylmuramidase NamZ family protein [Halosolutus gelatinilyticus]|uniref:exo-beta-N-acetylmuramidase NamZ family protein n=1 Tax=Halosolutus gelatinilyticus TaxID=2931975 RepID=UPI001FF52F99|nr:DUF1343 domain-containing protein [Halosolutus gelatinilyticus]